MHRECIGLKLYYCEVAVGKVHKQFTEKVHLKAKGDILYL